MILTLFNTFQGVTINIHQSSTQLWAKIRFLPHHCSTPRAEHLALRKTQEVKHVRVRLTPDVAYNPEISDNIQCIYICNTNIQYVYIYEYMYTQIYYIYTCTYSVNINILHYIIYTYKSLFFQMMVWAGHGSNAYYQAKSGVS